MLKKKKLNITEEQKKKCNAIIHIHAVACGGIGAGMAQIPLADNAVITPIQIEMIMELGVVFDQKITKTVAQSIISGAAASLIGRGASQVLLGWVPVLGNTINTATAAGLTEAIGWMAVDRFSKEKFVDDTLEADSKEEESSSAEANTTKEESTKGEDADEPYKDLYDQADAFISGGKSHEEFSEEYNNLLNKIEAEMKKLPKDHPLWNKYDELNSVSLR